MSDKPVIVIKKRIPILGYSYLIQVRMKGTKVLSYTITCGPTVHVSHHGNNSSDAFLKLLHPSIREVILKCST